MWRLNSVKFDVERKRENVREGYFGLSVHNEWIDGDGDAVHYDRDTQKCDFRYGRFPEYTKYNVNLNVLTQTMVR